MKQLIADFLSIDIGNIKTYKTIVNNDLHIETERDYDKSYPIVAGDIYGVQYEVQLENTRNQYIDLEELLVHIYNYRR